MRNLLPVLLTLFTLQSCGQSLRLVKADKLKDWKIDEYTIIYSKKLGPAGPHYYEYDIYKGDKYAKHQSVSIRNNICWRLFVDLGFIYTINLG
jgi:hypothetical protein